MMDTNSYTLRCRLDVDLLLSHALSLQGLSSTTLCFNPSPFSLAVLIAPSISSPSSCLSSFSLFFSMCYSRLLFLFSD